jgi:hypothetical protein
VTRDEHERRERLTRAHMDAMRDLQNAVDLYSVPPPRVLHAVLRTFRALEDFHSYEMS